MEVLYINKDVKLSIKNNNFCINKKVLIPAFEIKTIFIETFFSISKQFLELCNDYKITLIFADKKHLPTIMLLNPVNPYFKMYQFIKAQVRLDSNEDLKLKIWKSILNIKLLNSMSLLNKIEIKYFREVRKSNNKLLLLQIEGHFADIYYKELFGNYFKRQKKYFINKDLLNSFLNFGYSLLRSKIIHYLTLNGLMPCFSVFHSADNNNFALADDLIECYRYVIDYRAIKWIDLINSKKELDKELKTILLEIFNQKVYIKNKSFTLDNAIELGIKGYREFLKTKNFKCLKTLKTSLY